MTYIELCVGFTPAPMYKSFGFYHPLYKLFQYILLFYLGKTLIAVDLLRGIYKSNLAINT